MKTLPQVNYDSLNNGMMTIEPFIEQLLFALQFPCKPTRRLSENRNFVQKRGIFKKQAQSYIWYYEYCFL